MERSPVNYQCLHQVNLVPMMKEGYKWRWTHGDQKPYEKTSGPTLLLQVWVIPVKEWWCLNLKFRVWFHDIHLTHKHKLSTLLCCIWAATYLLYILIYYIHGCRGDIRYSEVHHYYQSGYIHDGMLGLAGPHAVCTIELYVQSCTMSKKERELSVKMLLPVYPVVSVLILIMLIIQRYTCMCVCVLCVCVLY